MEVLLLLQRSTSFRHTVRYCAVLCDIGGISIRKPDKVLYLLIVCGIRELLELSILKIKLRLVIL